MSAAAWRVALVIAGLVVPAAGAEAPGSLRCTQSLTRQLDRFATRAAAVRRRCVRAADVGACETHARAAETAMGTKVQATIARDCGSAPLFGSSPAGLGFPTTCAAPGIGLVGTDVCAGIAVADASSLAACLVCREQQAIDALAGWATPCTSSAQPLACAVTLPGCTDVDSIERRCLRRIAAAAWQLHRTVEGALDGCVSQVRAGRRGGPCPDLRAELQMAAAVSKTRRALTGCGVVPARWAACQPLVQDGTPACAALATISDVTDCLDRTTTALAVASSCDHRPSGADAGLPCPPGAVTTTTTTSPTSTLASATTTTFFVPTTIVGTTLTLPTVTTIHSTTTIRTTTTVRVTSTTPRTTTTTRPLECLINLNCNDGNACTRDSCRTGRCHHDPVGFGDGDPCTTDRCDPQRGPIHTLVDTNDGNPCTTDRCNPSNGKIEHKKIPHCHASSGPGHGDGGHD